MRTRARTCPLLEPQKLAWLAKITQLQAVGVSTRRAQRGTWQRFMVFLEAYNIPAVVDFVLDSGRSVPVVSIEAIITFMVDYCFVKHNSPASLEGELSRIKRHARQAHHVLWPDSLPFPDGRLSQCRYRDTLMSLKKNCTKPPKQKIPIRLDHIFKMAKTNSLARLSHLEAITRFLVSNLFCLRCKSAITLQAQHVAFKTEQGWRQYSRRNINDFTFPRDGEGQLIIWCRLELHKEKNNMCGPARTVTLPPWVHSSVCAGTVLFNWLVRSRPHDAQTVFAKFNNDTRRGNWSYGAAMRQIGIYATCIGMPKSKVGMHSLRRAGVCDYVLAGKLIPFIISVGGWKSMAFLTYFFADEHLLTMMSHRQHRLLQRQLRGH